MRPSPPRSAICVPFLQRVNTPFAVAAAASLSGRLALHAQVLTRIREALPFSLEPHCHSCVVDADGQRIVLYVEQMAYATQLRFHIPALIRKLQQDASLPMLKALRQIVIRIYFPEGLLQKQPVSLPPAWRQGNTDSASVLARLEQRLRSR
ncbi:MAG: hypothetical protein RIQ52_1432 [Pseudomonadota bacterium]